MRLTRWLTAALVAAAACNDSTGSGGNPCDGKGADAVITAGDNLTFSPQNRTILMGQKVCWQNPGSVPHTVTSNDNTSFASSLGAGASFVHTFASGGSFPYHCAIHAGMTGMITVTQ